MIALLALFACKTAPPSETAEPEPIPEVCDAGNEAWVQRTIPLLWGRKAYGSAEVRAWTAMTDQHGREAVVRAMSESPAYRSWWRQWLTDALAVARTGDKAYSACYGSPRREAHDGSLTSWIRSVDEPWDVSTPDGGAFNMADVVLDALVADDLAVPFQVHLYARMYRPVQGANVSLEELEYNRRVNFGEVFFETYLNRNLNCVRCHNSTFSVTDAADARDDLTWQLPGRHETALLGSNTDFVDAEAHAIFRYADVVRFESGRRPFGMHRDCGRFVRPDAVTPEDFIGQDVTHLVERSDATASVWGLERHLNEGANALADGLDLGEGEAVDPSESLAYLVGARIVDKVYEQATGGRLTIAHGFPRNLDQASRLEALTDAFVENGFSLRELLVRITDDALYNAGDPASCGADPYGLAPVINPWSVEEDDPALRGNTPGDLVHRHPARVLVNAANSHLGWGPMQSWLIEPDEADFQASIGVFLRESQPGFNGVDFQGLLAMHDRYATCPARGDDWIATLIEDHPDAPVRDAIVTLKDHLLANGAIAEGEEPLLEAMVGSLDTPLSAIDPRALRGVCGAILTSPQYMLVMPEEGVGAPPPLRDRTADACEAARALMSEAGFETTDCEPSGTTP